MQDKFWLADDLPQRRLFAKPTPLVKLMTPSPIGWWAIGMTTLILAVILTA
jgi:succinate-acetate transporter protein